jgi:dTDP-4-dehydrorhamnose 3,5-epimerase
MTIDETSLPGVLLLERPVFRDARGFFRELWRAEAFEAAGLPARFVQDNLSYSTRGVLRGLHYQHPQPQGKLICVLRGSIHDVAVDIRAGSPTFGRWVGVALDAESGRQLYVPEGFAHGFAVTGADALVLYKCTAPYRPGAEGSIRWDDPDLDIAWPLIDPVLSPKDAAAARLADVPADRLPAWKDSGEG